MGTTRDDGSRIILSDRTWAVASLVLFAVAGAAVFDDYGPSSMTAREQHTAAVNLEYILGNDGALSDDDFPVGYNRYFGMAFELPLLLTQRALGLESRPAYLLRSYAIHLFWLCGGFACFLLARRLFDSGPLALLAMLLFLLHPRLYAHAFFNSKDVPFLAMFMIALYLVHRAFEKDTVRAFVVLGMGTAVLTNLRIMGVMLFAAVLGMRALDLLHAAQRSGRRRVLKTTAAFGAAGAATLYAISPYLWSDPRQFAEALRVLSEHPNTPCELFQERLVRADDLPWRYVPTWMAITTPPFTLLLGVVGVVGTAWRAAAHPSRAAGNTPLRLECLVAACLTAPPLAVAALGANTFNGWRHLYFLHAPLCLLAASGLRLPTPPGCADGRMRRGTYAAAGVAAAGILASMARIHPYQHAYFNFLVDRTTPEHLRTHYYIRDRPMTRLGALRHLALAYPSTNLCVAASRPVHQFLSEAQRKRITVSTDRSGCGQHLDFIIYDGVAPFELHASEVWARKVYGNTIASMHGFNLALLDDPHADRARETYRSLTQNAPAARAHYDVYFTAARSALTYARAPCVQADSRARFFLHVVPVDTDDLPDDQVRYGFEHRDFNLPDQAMFDGKCLATVRLPEYAIDHVRTGQTEKKNDVWTALWEVTIEIAADNSMNKSP